ncbi:MAG: FAD-binding oxidoreductase [Pseudomonadota bacterium]|nr:FAD-binding oxidoreductase [Pseudomonadota bacterium]
MSSGQQVTALIVRTGRLLSLISFFGALFTVSMPAFAGDLYKLAADLAAGDNSIDIKEMGKIITEAQTLTDRHGRFSSRLQKILSAIETDFEKYFSEKAAQRFQDFAGEIGAIVLSKKLTLPTNKTSYWLKDGRKFQNFQSAPGIPVEADVVVIGAGLTGASAAYHLAKKGIKVIVLEALDPGMGASGHNGGNYELGPESFKKAYINLVQVRYDFLKLLNPKLSEETLQAQARRQAEFILRFGQRNGKRFLKIAEIENVPHVSTAGQLRIASSPEEEAGLQKEVEFARSLGLDMEFMSREKINSEVKIPAKYAGRKIPGFGNYHPFEFVTKVMEKVLDMGGELYTTVTVDSIEHVSKNNNLILTSRGTIRAKKVVVATNIGTRKVLPEITALELRQSQIFTLEHVKNNLKGMTVTEDKGDLYYNFPKSGWYIDENGENRGTLLIGGGEDTPVKKLKRTTKVMNHVKSRTDERMPETRGQPPSSLWVGELDFTPDRLPIIGFLWRNNSYIKDIVVAAGFVGFGGTFCVEAGYSAVEMLLEEKFLPGVPEDMFSPKRFKVASPLFTCPGQFN